MDTEHKNALAGMGLAAGGATLSSMTLNQWVAILTILYLVLQILLLTPKYYKLGRSVWKKLRG